MSTTILTIAYVHMKYITIYIIKFNYAIYKDTSSVCNGSSLRKTKYFYFYLFVTIQN
jgi:hypothetical protein